MANKVRFDYSKASKFINAHEVEYMSELAVAAREKLVSKSGAGNDFLGWIDLPVDSERFRSTSCDRNRWFLPWSKSCK